MTEVKITRALLSVSDKTGLVNGRCWPPSQTNLMGGTAAALRAAGLGSRVAELTGFPEMMDGRVRTLHPKVQAACSPSATSDHCRAMADHGSARSIVVINLYPFAATVARAPRDEIIENIDIGGPSMVRSAARSSLRHDRHRPPIMRSLLTRPRRRWRLAQKPSPHRRL